MTAGLKALVVIGLVCASMWTVYTQYVVLPMTDHVTSRTFRDQSIEQYEQILKTGLNVESTSATEFADLIRRDTVKWAKVVKAAGIQPE